jgi:hypothetical protein
MSIITAKEMLWEILEFFLHAIAEKDELDEDAVEHFKFKMSLGRSSWIVWFYATIYFIAIGVVLSYLWYLIGLSTLGYVIGTKYIVTNIGGASRFETANWDQEEHV